MGKMVKVTWSASGSYEAELGDEDIDMEKLIEQERKSIQYLLDILSVENIVLKVE